MSAALEGPVLEALADVARDRDELLAVLRRWIAWVDGAPDRECIAATVARARDLIRRIENGE